MWENGTLLSQSPSPPQNPDKTQLSSARPKQKTESTLTGVAQLVGHHLVKLKVTGLILGQDTYLG